MTTYQKKKNSPDEPHRLRHVGTILSQPTFNWKVQDRYVELLNFEMEVESVLQAKVYDLSDEEKVFIIKNYKELVRQRSLYIKTV